LYAVQEAIANPAFEGLTLALDECKSPRITVHLEMKLRQQIGRQEWCDRITGECLWSGREE